jgi:uncharacterized protein with PIN domain
MVRLYMDENVEGQITRGLRERGIDVLTAEEDGRNETPDLEILDRANTLGRVVFSRDQDFLREASRRQRISERFAGVIYAHKQKVSIGVCITDLEYLAQAGSPEDFMDKVYFLPL